MRPRGGAGPCGSAQRPPGSSSPSVPPCPDPSRATPASPHGAGGIRTLSPLYSVEGNAASAADRRVRDSSGRHLRLALASRGSTWDSAMVQETPEHHLFTASDVTAGNGSLFLSWGCHVVSAEAIWVEVAAEQASTLLSVAIAGTHPL